MDTELRCRKGFNMTTKLKAGGGKVGIGVIIQPYRRQELWHYHANIHQTERIGKRMHNKQLLTWEQEQTPLGDWQPVTRGGIEGLAGKLLVTEAGRTR